MGRIIVDILGCELTSEDRKRIKTEGCAGVILFARNFENRSQLTALTTEIKRIKKEPVFVCVDQEGGRVQRFQEGFTRIPPMEVLGTLWDKDQVRACELSQDVGIVLGAELKDVGVHLTFAPVLDINGGNTSVIGDRAFHKDPLAISELGRCLVRGLTYAGVGAVGKHFPGHGGVIEDTHLDEAIDSREVAEIMAQDVLPFKVLSSSLSGVMPSHVRYSKFDTQPACFSRQWLIDILRNDLNFQGLVFSDDLSMRAAELVGDVASRSRLAIDAGCDFILVCNNSEDADRALHSISDHRLNNDQQLMKKMFSTIDMPSFVNTGSGDYKASLSRIEST